MAAQSGSINFIRFTGRVELLTFGSSVEVRGCGQLADAEPVYRAFQSGKSLYYEGTCKYPGGEIKEVRIPITLWNPDLQPEQGRDIFFESLGLPSEGRHA
ncbi:hypothetical protein [Deinococcus misasensis]|uniref:hypothetical protein n=1 Tax=Deinococcus misasensis TaxID=392413 RepID=UPI00055631E1|nr:hypothetical protein [Deinococcus misasensis]